MGSRGNWEYLTGREATEYSSSGAIHLWVCSVVSPFTCSELSDYTVVGSALGSVLTVSMLVIVPVSLRCCFHQSSRVDPLKSGPRIAVIMDLDPLWAL